MFGLYEDERDLVQNGASLGADVQKLLDPEALEILWFPPVDASIDELAHKLLDAVNRRRACWWMEWKPSGSRRCIQSGWDVSSPP